MAQSTYSVTNIIIKYKFRKVFIAAYLGTDDQAVIGDYTRRLMAYYAVRLPSMLDLLVQGRLPEDALQHLPKVLG